MIHCLLSRFSVALLLWACIVSTGYSNDKILGTPGVSQVEGAGGGGLVPWAQLGGYADSDAVSVAGYCSKATLSDYGLDICGARLDLYDRLEISYAEQRFSVNALGLTIQQNITSMKIRLYGDVVYSDWPQLAVGIQHKSLQDNAVANLLGASEDSGQDFYVAMAKVHLSALWQRNVFWNLTLRNTDANQTGLLGFGAQNASRKWVAEASAALFLNHNLALGIEYRQKPDNLTTPEHDWRSLFVSWFINKKTNITFAYLDLGEIAGSSRQTGTWISVTGYW